MFLNWTELYNYSFDKFCSSLPQLMAAMNKILDKLFLGNIKAASDLKMLKAAVSAIQPLLLSKLIEIN